MLQLSGAGRFYKLIPRLGPCSCCGPWEISFCGVMACPGLCALSWDTSCPSAAPSFSRSLVKMWASRSAAGVGTGALSHPNNT
jgi:hypothetical protein